MSEYSLSLSELNNRVKIAINSMMPESYWVRAETSDVRRNRNGHCYLEFLEKDLKTQALIAKARGVIWSNVYEMISAYFEKETGQTFTSGLNVLVRVTVDFHALYGFSLTVVDIDPSFTSGEIARNRQLVLKKLEAEGVINMNKELNLPEFLNRIAVISSPTAAGFEDFKDQLNNNPAGLKFYTKLFPTIMQGDRSESSVIQALEKIYLNIDKFDAIAIIRGGGASADLNSFDSYLLANNVAQFPLPVVSGIGHERDVTVLDAVSHTRAKTPTAVAEFFITHLSKTVYELVDLQERLLSESQNRLSREKTTMLTITKDIIYHSTYNIEKEKTNIDNLQIKIKHQTIRFIQDQAHILSNAQQFINMVSPDNILKRGYTLTLKDGEIITTINKIKPGDKIETRFHDGVLSSKVLKTK